MKDFILKLHDEILKEKISKYSEYKFEVPLEEIFESNENKDKILNNLLNNEQNFPEVDQSLIKNCEENLHNNAKEGNFQESRETLSCPNHYIYTIDESGKATNQILYNNFKNSSKKLKCFSKLEIKPEFDLKINQIELDRLNSRNEDDFCQNSSISDVFTCISNNINQSPNNKSHLNEKKHSIINNKNQIYEKKFIDENKNNNIFLNSKPILNSFKDKIKKCFDESSNLKMKSTNSNFFEKISSIKSINENPKYVSNVLGLDNKINFPLSHSSSEDNLNDNYYSKNKFNLIFGDPFNYNNFLLQSDKEKN